MPTCKGEGVETRARVGLDNHTGWVWSDSEALSRGIGRSARSTHVEQN